MNDITTLEWMIFDNWRIDGRMGVEYAVIDNNEIIPLVSEFSSDDISVYLVDEKYLPLINVICPNVTLDTFRVRFADSDIAFNRWVKI